jgi:dTDP-4-dehydrorhamnose reductase
VVVHTAAVSQVDYCEQNPAESDAVNFESVKNLAYLSQCRNFRLVFLSSDFVFYGDRGHYNETDIPLPLSRYGQQKFNSEKYLMHNCRQHSIVRTSLVYGYLHRMSRSNIILMIKDRLEQKQGLRIVNDQFRSPTLAEDLASGILEIIRQNRTGIYHLSGRNFLSVYDFAKIVATSFGLDSDLISPVSTQSLNEAARRPSLTGLVIDKARKDLGYLPVTVEEGIKIVADQIRATEQSSS